VVIYEFDGVDNVFDTSELSQDESAYLLMDDTADSERIIFNNGNTYKIQKKTGVTKNTFFVYKKTEINTYDLIQTLDTDGDMTYDVDRVSFAFGSVFLTELAKQVDFEVQPGSNFNRATGEITFIVKNIGELTSGGTDYRRIFEVTTDIDEAVKLHELPADSSFNFTNSDGIPVTYYQKNNDTSFNIILTSEIDNNYVLGCLNDDNTFLTNSPEQNADDTISFVFTGNFQVGHEYMVSADDPLANGDWPNSGHTIERIDDGANPSNNYFVFTYQEPVAPDVITISSIGEDSVVVSNAVGDTFDIATSFDLEVLPSGDTPIGIATVSTISFPYTFSTGLIPGTSCSIYARANQPRGSGDWTGPFEFTTLEPFVEEQVVPAPITSASALGDPYISTLCGKKFKLPNSTKIYRMTETTYNNKQLIINAGVSQLTEQEITFLKKFTSKITNRRPVTNGYFFDKFFISYGNKYVIFNRDIELIETNITQNDTEFSINFNNELKDFSCPLQLQGKCKQKETNIKIADKITINLLNIFNPQIINGVEFNYNGNNENIKGVFNTFYHPKNYVIKQIDNTKPIKLKTNLPEYKKQISDKFDLLI
jgi:hypothetical protein